jgi:hypothetical protein
MPKIYLWEDNNEYSFTTCKKTGEEQELTSVEVTDEELKDMLSWTVEYYESRVRELLDK